MDWFTADPHFGHTNIIRYAQRPFESVQQMDDMIIGNINTLVDVGDVLWVLGDWCLGVPDKKKAAFEYRSRIRCATINFIMGNHDPDAWRYGASTPFTRVHGMWEGTLGGKSITLCHYALRVWDKSHKGAIQLYGHSHGTLPPVGRQLDVGVDNLAYMPISLPDVIERMKNIPISEVDHHNVCTT